MTVAARGEISDCGLVTVSSRDFSGQHVSWLGELVRVVREGMGSERCNGREWACCANFEGETQYCERNVKE